MAKTATLQIGDATISIPVKKILKAIMADVVAGEVDSLPALADGEIYAGIVLDAEAGKPSHHLILLPGEFTGSWAQAKEWAASIGGELPTRQEQSFLFAQLKRLFQPKWHWSSEEHSSGYAWGQDFYDGTQDSSGKSYDYLARAVRRSFLQ